jgi:hypothetical protein
MEVSKVPADVSPPRAGTSAAAEPGPQSADNQTPDTIAPLADRADIRPLDISSALQILLAEVRAELAMSIGAASAQLTAPQGTAARTSQGAATQPTASRGATAQGAIAPSPAHTARELIELFLQALPEDAGNAPAWTDALVRVEAAVQSGMDRAIGVVTQWRDVPPVVVDAVKDARALFVAALADEPPNPLWLRPEWLGLGPLWLRFQRRRRAARRRLTDPDDLPQSLDESEEFHR